MDISEFFKSLKKNGRVDDTITRPVIPEVAFPDAGITKPPSPKTPQKEVDYHHYFHLLRGKDRSKIGDYNFELHGSLVEVHVPEDYEPIDRYWIDKGQSQVLIALNKKTNQKDVPSL